MRGCRVLIKVILLHVLAVIALVSREAKESFFKDRIAAVPQRESEADHLVAVGDAADAVFAPAVGTRARMVVREIFPSGAAGTVVFANRSPLALGEIRSPALPVFFSIAVFLEPLVFLGLKSGHGLESLSRRSQIMVYGRIFCESRGDRCGIRARSDKPARKAQSPEDGMLQLYARSRGN